MVSRVCEEFGCLPSRAVAELMEHDELVLDVMESRAYARTKEQMDGASNEKEMPTGPMVRWVWEVEHELLRRRRVR